MKFTEYYKGIVNKKERQNLRDSILQVTGVQNTTFYSWLHRNIVPEIYKMSISNIIGIDKEELFPTEIDKQSN